MIDRDVILEKINSVQRCLGTILKVTGNDEEKLDDVFIQDVVVLNLQRAVQLCIDMASHLVASLKWGLPSSLKDFFVILQHNNVLDPELTEKMGKMVGFRNTAVHDYQELNINILKSIVRDHLSDFEKFYVKVLNYLDKLEKK